MEKQTLEYFDWDDVERYIFVLDLAPKKKISPLHSTRFEYDSI
jgi:hypothetical protein